MWADIKQTTTSTYLWQNYCTHIINSSIHTVTQGELHTYQMSVTSYKVPSTQPVGLDSNPEGTGSIKHSPFPLACVSNVFEESVFATQENCLTQGENQSSTVHKGEIYINSICVKQHHTIPKLTTQLWLLLTRMETSLLQWQLQHHSPTHPANKVHSTDYKTVLGPGDSAVNKVTRKTDVN